MKRPFRGLRDRPPRPAYDAVIVGAGIGGLFCANLLAREGLKVLLVEQHYMVGGYCSTFRRKGYTFDAASHFYPLLGDPSTLTGRLLPELGIRTEWVRMDPVDTFHLPDGSRFDVPADLDRYRARLDELFPHEAANLERFFVAVREAYLGGLLAYFRGATSRRFERYRGFTVRQALDRFFEDERLKLLLTADCPHWGSPPERTSFVFDSMLRLSYFLGNYYPRGGSQAFADELARAFEERGGDILTSTRVESITVAGGAAAGVELETLRGPLRGGYAVRSGVVVSNADLLLTLKSLLPKSAVEPDEIAAIERLRPSFPCFLSHLGLRGISTAELERVQGYYWQGWDPDAVGKDDLICKIFVPTLYDPALAPEGGQIVVLQKVVELEEPVSSWPEHKAALEQRVTDHLRSVLPGVDERIVVQLSATAHTAERFTLNQAGSMLGWEMSPEQLGAGRPPNLGGIERLYYVGHWTRPGGGITPVIVSAVQVAEAITRGKGPAAAALGLDENHCEWTRRLAAVDTTPVPAAMEN